MQALPHIDEDFSDAPGKDKTMCIVDSGIAFNSPFPAMIRPERKVELILSFDFSQRDGGDKELPFKVSILQHVKYQLLKWKSCPSFSAHDKVCYFRLNYFIRKKPGNEVAVLFAQLD